MQKSAKVASAEYETVHDGKSCPCAGTILATDDAFLLQERIQVGHEAYDERSSPYRSKKRRRRVRSGSRWI
jgi:hypothetical protein